MTQTRLVGALLAVGLLAGAPAAAEPKAGSRLDQSNGEEAKDLVAPELLAHYKEGKFAAPVGEIKPGDYALDDRFHQATKANAGKFKLDEHGSVVEAATGKPPEYSFGGPFPDLDPEDPQVASKIMWNYEYAYWSNGDNRLQAYLMWLDESSKSPERAIAGDTRAKVLARNANRAPH